MEEQFKGRLVPQKIPDLDAISDLDLDDNDDLSSISSITGDSVRKSNAGEQTATMGVKDLSSRIFDLQKQLAKLEKEFSSTMDRAFNTDIAMPETKRSRRICALLSIGLKHLMSQICSVKGAMNAEIERKNGKRCHSSETREHRTNKRSEMIKLAEIEKKCQATKAESKSKTLAVLHSNPALRTGTRSRRQRQASPDSASDISSATGSDIFKTPITNGFLRGATATVLTDTQPNIIDQDPAEALPAVNRFFGNPTPIPDTVAPFSLDQVSHNITYFGATGINGNDDTFFDLGCCSSVGEESDTESLKSLPKKHRIKDEDGFRAMMREEKKMLRELKKKCEEDDRREARQKRKAERAARRKAEKEKKRAEALSAQSTTKKRVRFAAETKDGDDDRGTKKRKIQKTGGRKIGGQTGVGAARSITPSDLLQRRR